MSRVLVVEDDKDIAALIGRYLSKAGYTTEVVNSGADVVPRVRQDPPALLILDLMLPGVSGLQICSALRAEPTTSAVPIIMLTARGEEADRVLGLELGADDYVTKPFSPNELVARVRALSAPILGTRGHRESIAIRPHRAGLRTTHGLHYRRSGQTHGERISASPGT